jgi:hypothetical protein
MVVVLVALPPRLLLPAVAAAKTPVPPSAAVGLQSGELTKAVCICGRQFFTSASSVAKARSWRRVAGVVVVVVVVADEEARDAWLGVGGTGGVASTRWSGTSTSGVAPLC